MPVVAAEAEAVAKEASGALEGALADAFVEGLVDM